MHLLNTWLHMPLEKTVKKQMLMTFILLRTQDTVAETFRPNALKCVLGGKLP